MVISAPDIAEAQNLVQDLEALHDVLPWILFEMKMRILLARRAIEAEGLGSLLDGVTMATEDTVPLPGS